MTKKQFIIILSILLISISCVFAYKHMNKPEEITTVTMSKEDVLDEQKVKQYVNANSDANLNTYQSQEIVHTVERIIERDKKPTQIVTTTGSNYKEESKKVANDKKADAVIVAPSKNEDKKIEDIKENDIVNLNQYNVYAYPKRQLSFTYYADGDKAIDLEYQVKVFGKHMYAGPSIKVSDDGKTTIGAKLTIPF